MVFSGIYPINTADYEGLKVAIAKLQLNDSALTFMAESSAALGFGLRCGFLGLLHMEIVQERLRREFDMDIIATYPSVIYKVKMTDGRELEVDNPAFLPKHSHALTQQRLPVVQKIYGGLHVGQQRSGSAADRRRHRLQVLRLCNEMAGMRMKRQHALPLPRGQHGTAARNHGAHSCITVAQRILHWPLQHRNAVVKRHIRRQLPAINQQLRAGTNGRTFGLHQHLAGRRLRQRVRHHAHLQGCAELNAARHLHHCHASSPHSSKSAPARRVRMWRSVARAPGASAPIAR